MEVASYVGAWIETTELMPGDHVSMVASYVGAWIETATNAILIY